MVRGALWLISEIGEGNTFTKEQVRQAFPRVSQADRRIRDLRAYGWVIYTSHEDASLQQEEQRFVRAGVAVWDPGERRRAGGPSVSAKQRRAVLAADDFQCVICGIAGGEAYPDMPNTTAVLSVSRRAIVAADGAKEELLVTECKVCRSGDSGNRPVDVARLMTEIGHLDGEDLARLRRWMERGRRGATPLDRVWTQYRRLPSEAREQIRRRVQV